MLIERAVMLSTHLGQMDTKALDQGAMSKGGEPTMIGPRRPDYSKRSSSPIMSRW